MGLFIHGYRPAGKASKTYAAWRNMRQRCVNPKHTGYKNYGHRGITVCPEWDSFEQFLTDLGEAPEGLMLERRDNDKGYSKDNCYWTTRHKQNRNKRDNRFITFAGVTLCSNDWAKTLGLNRDCLYSRLRRNWSVTRAFTEGSATD